MKIEMQPTTTINALADAVNLQYNLNLDSGDLLNLLFYGDYQNDCYKTYYYDDDNSDITRNLINQYLRDILPAFDSILIDVSW